MRFERYHKYGPLNSHDLLKCSAIILMIIDHIGMYLFTDISDLRFIGRFAMPLFLFLVGYSLHYQFKWGLIIWASLILVASVSMHHPVFALNILFSIAITRLLLQWLVKRDYIGHHLIAIWVACVVWYIPTSVLFDYGTMNLLFAVCGYLVVTQGNTKLTQSFIIATLLLHIIIQSIDHQLALYQIAIYLPVMLLIGWGMLHYRLQDYPHINPIISSPIRFIGRYSLEVYAIHLLLLQWAATLVFPEKYMIFIWFGLAV